jgi:histidine triad (HIT) family protein
MPKELKFADGCVFCNIAQGQVFADFLHNDDEVMAFNDINPKAPVHVLVLPKGHVNSVLDIAEADAAMLGKMFLVAKDIAKQKNLEGFKIVVNVGRGGGQIIDHLHLHILSGAGMQMP